MITFGNAFVRLTTWGFAAVAQGFGHAVLGGLGLGYEALGDLRLAWGLGFGLSAGSGLGVRTFGRLGASGSGFGGLCRS